MLREIEAQQMGIVECYLDGDTDGAHRKQKELVRFGPASWWAVKKVTSGNKSSGIDEQI